MGLGLVGFPELQSRLGVSDFIIRLTLNARSPAFFAETGMPGTHWVHGFKGTLLGLEPEGFFTENDDAIGEQEATQVLSLVVHFRGLLR
jgi:hypothetical protein